MTSALPTVELITGDDTKHNSFGVSKMSKRAAPASQKPSGVGRAGVPTVTKPVAQNRVNLSKGYTNTTSTDTWNKPVSNINLSGPSTITSVAGVKKPQPPQVNNPGKARKPVSKPLPGGKLRPLYANKLEENRYKNTWAPQNLSVSNGVSKSSSRQPVRAKAASTVKTENSSSIKSRETPESRGSSVASTKPVLPGIQAAQSPSNEPSSSEKHLDVGADSAPQPTGGVRAQSAKDRPSVTAHNKLKTAAEHVIELEDMFIPEWYKNPKIEPEQMKGGVTVLLLDRNMGERSFWSEIAISTEEVLFLPLPHPFCNTKYDDIEEYISEVKRESIATLILCEKTDPEWQQTLDIHSLSGYLPKKTSLTLAEKFNALLQLKDGDVYFPIEENSDTWILDLPKASRAMIKDIEESALKELMSLYNVKANCLAIAEQLAIKVFTDQSEAIKYIQTAVKRNINMKKQEKVIHSNVYLQPIELEDMWTQVNRCHEISKSCFSREEDMNRLKSRLQQALHADSSAPVILAGEAKSGKTWLCAQVPQHLPDATVLVRFCGFTRLSNTLQKVLISLSKQLHAIFGSPILPKTFNSSVEEIYQMFVEVLTNASSRAQQPVIIVLDGLDKLADTPKIAKVISLCSLPTNVALLISMASDESSGEYFVHDNAKQVDTALTALNRSIGRSIVEQMLDELDMEDTELLTDALENDKSSLFKEDGSLDKKMVLSKIKDSTLEKQYSDVVAELKKGLGDEKGFAEYVDLLSKLKTLEQEMIVDPSEEIEEKIIDLEARVELWEKPYKDREEIQAKDEYIQELEELRASEEKKVKVVKSLADQLLLGVDRISGENTFYSQICALKSPEELLLLKNLTRDESVAFIKHYTSGKVNKAKEQIITGIAEFIHSPLLLRVYTNICIYRHKPEVVYALLQEGYSGHNEKIFEIYKTMNQDKDEATKTGSVLCAAQIIVTHLIEEMDLTRAIGNLDELLDSASSSIAWNATGLTWAETSWLASEEWNLWLHHRLVCRLLLEGCVCSLYELENFVPDGENILQFLEFSERMSKVARTTASRHSFLLKAWKAFVNMIDPEFRLNLEAWEKVLQKAMSSCLNEDTEETDFQEHLLSTSILEEIISNPEQAVPTDLLEKPIEILEGSDSEDEDLKKKEEPTDTQNDIKVKLGGRWRCIHWIQLENAMLDELLKVDDFETALLPCELVLFDYPNLLAIVTDYGVDYVIDVMETFLMTIRKSGIIKNPVVVAPWELMYQFFISSAQQLREKPATFSTEFLTRIDEDACLASPSLFKLYKQVKSEVERLNYLHTITVLVNPNDSMYLSPDGRRNLQLTARKYAAAECISNASYILSHNRKEQVKLWELTGEFISAQRLDGQIVAVCPQREHRSFLAVVQKVSDVGEKFASVWLINRLTHEKLADVGSRTILSAWFDKDGKNMVMCEQCSSDEIRIVILYPKNFYVSVDEENHTIKMVSLGRTNFMDKSHRIPHRVDAAIFETFKKTIEGEDKKSATRELAYYVQNEDVYDLDLKVNDDLLALESLNTIWDDVLEKFDAVDDLVYPVEENCSENYRTKEHLNKMKVTVLGMTSTGDIVLCARFSDNTNAVFIHKFEENGDIVLREQLQMNHCATMTLMPSDDFVFSDTGSNRGLTSWHLPSDGKRVFGNEQNEYVTCLQFEIEEGQILSFTRGKVTVWNAMRKTTESSFTLDRNAEIVAACLQDNWLMTANREGEMCLRLEIRKKKATYHFHQPIDWIDGHVIGDYLYLACHVNGLQPSICFLKYSVKDDN